MTALLIERKTPKLGQDVLPSMPTNAAMPVAASARIFEGAICALATTGTNAGNVVQGQTALGLVALGVAEKTADNSTGTAGALTIVPRQGVFQLNNATGADTIGVNNVGQDCYMVDDNVVALTNGGGTRSRAGVIVAVDAVSPGQSQPAGVWVLVGITGSTAAYGATPSVTSPDHTARFVVTSALAAYANVAGVITANANGAWATQDGITGAVGDRILLPDGIAAAAADAGLWVITSLGAAGAKFVLTRAADWASGSGQPSGSEIEVTEGTLFAQSTWKLMTAGISTVDTTAVKFVPRTVTQAVTLASGTATVANVPILSATKTAITSNRTTPSGTTSTIAYNGSTITPGALGTASLTFQAQVAAGTINASDASVLNVTITNW